jgi:peptidoglycan/xylan/chitin deacetylase (PgdA/CDA1 family)
MISDRVLRVMSYQYVRDSTRNAFPKLNALHLDDFRQQVKELAVQYEIASIESSLDFLAGEYRPRRDLCLLTFDGGLKEHLTEVLPVLVERRIRAVFLVITSCVEEKRMAAVHMNDFLLAEMGFENYADAFFRKAVAVRPDAFAPMNVDPGAAAENYPWDTPEIANFKYLFNFAMDPDLRNRVVSELFTEHISEERPFAESLYLDWADVKQMQKSGMSIGGNTHQHRPLAKLTARELSWDLETCQRLLFQNLMPQSVWPFSYSYGKRDSFHIRAVRMLQQLGFRCAFSTESGDNRRGSDLYTVCRTEGKKALAIQARA